MMTSNENNDQYGMNNNNKNDNDWNDINNGTTSIMTT